LHLNYEDVLPLESVAVTGDRANCIVSKMRFLAKDRKDTIIYNGGIRVENIPAEAYEYVVNGKSAIEWILERYQVKTDKDSGIVNDPNKYAEEIGKPSYILDLLLSVIAVSVKTVEIVKGLPGWGV
jgi:predicted helicase